MIDGQTCGSCAAFYALNNQCRRKSPTPVLIPSPVGQGQMASLGIYPATKKEDWCLEWQSQPIHRKDLSV